MEKTLKLGRNDFKLGRNDSDLGRNDFDLGRNDLGRNGLGAKRPVSERIRHLHYCTWAQQIFVFFFARVSYEILSKESSPLFSMIS